MKKILIGAILTSSLAMSGDLEKCTQAIEMENKYDEATHRLMKERIDFKVFKNEKMEKYIGRKERAYKELTKRWKEEIQEQCKDILANENIKNVTLH